METNSSTFFTCKNLSNLFKVLDVVFMVLCFLLTKKPVGDIIAMGGAIIAPFLTIDANKIISNAKSKDGS
jgi:hypothetical protein